jgi:two-component system, chemotaxis family, CheB/CheR fusion protein
VELESRLIDDLLDVTRIARGKVELDKRPVELGTIIERAVEVCRPDIEARQLEFGVKIEGGPYVVEADAARLQQVFWNLLKNAVKFTPVGGCVGIRCRLDEGWGFRVQGSGSARISLNPEPRTLSPSVLIEVSDSGVGIEPEVLPRIFKAFEQVDRSVTQQFGGLGLGLTISKAMVEMHGGSIEAISEGKNKGATFRVRLPQHVGAGHAPPSPGTSKALGTEARARHASPLRILLVEDHGDTARVMKRLLTAEGHQVQTAGDVATAIQLIGSQPFDLLVSDLGLPDGSGVELMRSLRSRGQTLLGIAVSGYGQEQDIQRSKEAGFSVHLTKPTSLERLAEAIAAVSGVKSGPPEAAETPVAHPGLVSRWTK